MNITQKDQQEKQAIGFRCTKFVQIFI